MRLLAPVLGVLLVPLAAAHDAGWGDEWHDFGESLGAFGRSPIGGPTGLCWRTDSTFLDAADPGFLSPDEVNGHEGGLGADPAGCGRGPPAGHALGSTSVASDGAGADATARAEAAVGVARLRVALAFSDLPSGVLP